MEPPIEVLQHWSLVNLELLLPHDEAVRHRRNDRHEEQERDAQNNPVPDVV